MDRLAERPYHQPSRPMISPIKDEVLVVEANTESRDALGAMLSAAGFSVELAPTVDGARTQLSLRAFDVVLIDWTSGGLGFMREARALRGDTEQVIVTSPGEHEAGVEALREGAYEVFEKPLVGDRVARAVVRAVERRRLKRTVVEHRARNSELEARVIERTRALEQAQEQLVRRERLAILGRMAGSVSHEIRNPLGVLRNSVYFLKMVLAAPIDEEILHHLVMMEEEIDRANRIVGDLLEYARVRAPVPRDIALSTVLARALRDNAMPPGVNVTRDFDPEAPTVSADAEQLRVVFGNLVRNAVQSMGGNGTLTVRVRSLPGAVVSEVSDSGPGINPEVRDRLFEPLFTTKTKGLGLGLATARNLVEVHHGTLTVESIPGQGATFRVSLPVPEGHKGSGGVIPITRDSAE